jgi:RNA polymerase sigma-70 factor (ECF subfamily)
MTDRESHSQSVGVTGNKELACAPPLDLGAIYEAELTHVWHTLRRFGVRDRDLEDLCHDVFVAFYRSSERFDPLRPLKPWLSGIAFRVASDYRRRAHHRRELIGESFERSPSLTPRADDALSAHEERSLVVAALDALDEGRRAVLVMHDIDETPMPLIAEVLGVPLNTGYSRLRLARVDFAAAVRRLQRRGKP